MAKNVVEIANPKMATRFGFTPGLTLFGFGKKQHVLLSPRGVDVFHLPMDNAPATCRLARDVAF